MGLSQQIGASSLIKPGVIPSAAERPASPYEGQVIFQKDTDQMLVWNGAAWVEIASALTKAPRGVMGTVYRTTGDFTANTVLADITGMSITFTAVAGRLYKASWGASARKETASGWTQISLTDNANVFIALSIQNALGGQYVNLSGVSIISGLTAGSKTFKLRAVSENNTSTMFANSGAPCQFIIEDIGAA